MNPAIALASSAPLGERIGPFVFWGILAVLLAVIVWGILRRRARARSRPRTPAVDGTMPEAYADHHTVRWVGSPDEPIADAQSWPLGVTAIFGICAGEPWDRLPLANLDNVREGLVEAWGVRSRPQLLARLAWLLREGHREQFAAAVRSGDRLDGTPPVDAPEELREFSWRLRQVRADARGIRQVDFLAWDLMRAAMLTRAGFSLGWLNDAEARDTLNLISTELQSRYASWAQLGDAFRTARWFWAAPEGLEARTQDAHDLSRQRALLDPARGPWPRLRWDQPLPHSRMLLADLLVTEGLVEDDLTPASDSLGQRIDRVIAARRAAM